ncbi:MAG TPA: BamA/TamA family outer membrane protein [Longimicrobiales bacterium]|nr:BamA/TamA family outer membrane protein [Longimicrobiales bacterium]
MFPLLAATLLLIQVDTFAVGASIPVPLDAYEDAEVRTLVEGARERRERVDRSIAAYEAVSRERISVGLNTPGRERLLYREESVARVRWVRGERGTLEMLGARAVAPVFTTELSVPDAPIQLVFDPVDDGLVAGLGGPEFLRHPLDPGSEANYRFRPGDTAGIRLPDGREIRLREVVVEPRHDDPRLIGGSLWIDADSYAVVRAQVRPVRPFQLWELAPDSVRGRERRRPGNGYIEGEIRQILVEYAYWDNRWWMPAIVVFDGEARIGQLLAVPLRVERLYTEYSITGDPSPSPPVPRLEISELRRADAVACDGDSENCQCRGGRCRLVAIERPEQDSLLIASRHFEGTIYDGGPILSEAELEKLAERLQAVALRPWQLADPGFDWRFARGGQVRYNRVEGLSVGGEAGLDFGRASLTGVVRYGIAAERFEPELRASLAGMRVPVEAGVYDRLAVANPATRALGTGNSLMALVFGRDDGEYFRARGVEITRTAGSRLAARVDWRAYYERQSPVAKETDFSFRRWGNDGFAFRDNIAAERADQAGIAMTLRGQHGLNPGAVRLGAEASVVAETGTFDFVRAGATVRMNAPLGDDVAGAVEIAAGTMFGDSPVQSHWFLGGPRTLRGFPGAAASGPSFWRARAEVGTAMPGARITLFADAGWAGARDELAHGRPLVGVGAGFGLFDGLIRFDVARAVRGGSGWRADFYLDGIM